MIKILNFFLPGGAKRRFTECRRDFSSALIGNSANNMVAVYNTNYSVMAANTKLAPATCRAYAHELYIARSGVDRLDLQASIGSPILKASCSYAHPRSVSKGPNMGDDSFRNFFSSV